MDQIIEDKELGKLVIRTNLRAKQFVFRTTAEAIFVTTPPGVKQSELLKVVDKLRPKLLDSLQKIPQSERIDFNYKLTYALFSFSLIKGNSERVYAQMKPDSMNIICPASTDFADDRLQTWFKSAILRGLRHAAKHQLPGRLRELSGRHKLAFNSVKINSSQGRWGSCSSKKSINLSFYLMLLPEHLVDYVLLHELCHTVEMNHNSKFWTLLSSLTDGKALELRNELRAYKAAI